MNGDIVNFSYNAEDSDTPVLTTFFKAADHSGASSITYTITQPSTTVPMITKSADLQVNKGIAGEASISVAFSVL